MPLAGTSESYEVAHQVLMNLPSGYRQTVNAGAAVLQALGAQLRRAASAQADRPELWLAVRDYEGLAGRLLDTNDFEWKEGQVRIQLSGQDIGVLDELIDRLGEASLRMSDEDIQAVKRLRQFLRSYIDHEFDLRTPLGHRQDP